MNCESLICMKTPCECEKQEQQRRKEFMDDYLKRNEWPRDYELPKDEHDYHD